MKNAPSFSCIRDPSFDLNGGYDGFSSAVRQNDVAANALATKAAKRSIFINFKIMPEYPYILKGPSIEDLNGELDHFWKDLNTNADLKDHIKAKGIDLGKSRTPTCRDTETQR